MRNRLSNRVRRLENPPSPRGRGKGPRAVTLQEIEERERRRYEAIATEHPERVEDYLEAKAELGRALQEHEEGTPSTTTRSMTSSKPNSSSSRVGCRAIPARTAAAPAFTMREEATSRRAATAAASPLTTATGTKTSSPWRSWKPRSRPPEIWATRRTLPT